MSKNEMRTAVKMDKEINAVSQRMFQLLKADPMLRMAVSAQIENQCDPNALVTPDLTIKILARIGMIYVLQLEEAAEKLRDRVKRG